MINLTKEGIGAKRDMDAFMPHDCPCPSLRISTTEAINAPMEGTAIIKFRRTIDECDTTKKDSPRYNCELQIEGIEFNGEKESEDDYDEIDVGQSLKRAMRKKMAEKMGEEMESED